MERQPIENTFHTDHNNNPTGGMSQGQGFAIDWQNGILERNGAYLEEVLEACLARLYFFQDAGLGKFRCRENALAITHIEEALHWLDHRTQTRVKRGVEGTYTP